MNSYAKTLREELTSAEIRLKDLQKNIAKLERHCWHDWSATQANHVYIDGCNPAHPRDTMGIDWRAAQTVERWSRTCKECGKIEFTNKTTEQVIKTPTF